MKRSTRFATLATLTLVAGVRAGEPARSLGELRVYLYDASRRPLSPPLETRVYLEPKAGGRRVLKPELVQGTGAADPGLHHGGQLRALRTGETVELVIVPPDAAPVATSSQPYLRAEIDLVEYACPMKCAFDTKPGDCPKCGMEMKAGLLELDAVVALKLEGEWLNAKGFRFPPIRAPKTLRESVEQLAALAAEIKTLVETGKLDRIHAPALAVTEIGKLLRSLAFEANVDDAAMKPLAARLTELGTELDRAGDGGHAAQSSRLLGELQSRIETLRGLAH